MLFSRWSPKCTNTFKASACVYTLTFPVRVCVLVVQSCSTLCDPMGCSLPGSPVHGILQARMLEWVAVSFSANIPQTKEKSKKRIINGKRTESLLIGYRKTLEISEYTLNNNAKSNPAQLDINCRARPLHLECLTSSLNSLCHLPRI